jgi:serine/threonine-protein kinase
VVLPPPRKRRRESGSEEQPAQRKSSFLTFVLAVLVAAGLLALIGWQAAPWLTQPPKTTTQAPAAQPPQPAPPQPEPASPAPKSEDEPKPSPMSPPVAAAKMESQGEPQEVTVISSPGAATVTLDGRPDSTCATPCVLEARPGRHRITVAKDGFQTEEREFEVGSGPVELPGIMLRAPGGSLMLSSTPSGGNILVNGKPTGRTTPAQINLAAGTYQITVEKDGRQSTQSIEIKTGVAYMKITIGQ